ncbi:MAG: TonB family protein [Woeseia sp.]
MASKLFGRELDATTTADELDDAVTSRISKEAVSRALSDDVTCDPAELRVINSQLSVRADLAEGDTLDIGYILKDRFEIVELVHSSEMGHVYKAIDHLRNVDGSGKIHVAIKMMRRSIASQRDAGLALEREAAKAQRLSHPNIINIFDFDHHNGRFFLVMEWLTGESVNSLLRRTKGQQVARAFAWDLIRSAAAAAQHSHRNNVVHADINPSNIFVTDSGDVKLLDFGVARFIGDSTTPDDGQFEWATPTYASPQVLSGSTPGIADDVFSLGCVAFRLLCGKHPFDGMPSLTAMQKNFTLKRIDGLADIDWRVLQQALAFELADRPDSMDLFLRDGTSREVTIDAYAVAVRRSDVNEMTGAKDLTDARWPYATKPKGFTAAIAIILVAGAWWLWQQKTDVVESLPPAGITQTVTSTPAAPSAAEALVSAAADAVAAGQFVTSTGDDARTLFRYAIAMDPENAAALRGLRTISDVYVQRANDALFNGDIAGAYAAIEIAKDSDAGNPAIAITYQLMVAQGNSALAAASLATTAGNIETATEQLARAAEFRHIEPAAIQSMRLRIAQHAGDGELLASLELAEAHIAAGKLLPPGLDNAYAVLTRMRESHADDARLLISMERLGERLLTRVAFATAAAQFEKATEMLDSVDSLGVLTAEVARARSAMLASEIAFEKKQAEALKTAADSKSDVETTPAVVNNLVATAASAASVTPVDTEPADAVANEMPATGSTAQIAEPTESAESRLVGINDVEFTKFVEPVFPRRALRRDVTGYVHVEFNVNTDGTTDSIDVMGASPDNVFNSSAVNAVKQWRFQPRDSSVRVGVKLRFDLPPEG